MSELLILSQRLRLVSPWRKLILASRISFILSLPHDKALTLEQSGTVWYNTYVITVSDNCPSYTLFLNFKLLGTADHPNSEGAILHFPETYIYRFGGAGSAPHTLHKPL